MAVGPQPEKVTGKLVAALLFAAAFILIVSIIIITRVAHNEYMAGYFTAEALLDASGFGADASIATQVTPFSNAFYLVMGTAMVDGIAKSVIVGFVLAAFISFITNIDVRSRLGFIATKNAKNHVIVCGYSMLAEKLCRDLKERYMPFVVIEKDPERASTLRDLGYNTVNGDFTDKQVLEDASIDTARAIVFATESDFINLLGIVTARHMNQKVEIITRVRDEAAITKMHRGGASFCLVPEEVAGMEIGRRITGG